MIGVRRKKSFGEQDKCVHKLVQALAHTYRFRQIRDDGNKIRMNFN